MKVDNLCATKLELNVPNDFFLSEVRCGFCVTTEKKKIWAIELDLLNKFMSVCNRHHIKFVVFGGTLLGAIRHKGFIPWDDDIDVALLREDYDKLCGVAKQEFQEPYFFQTCLTDRKYFISNARLRNSLTTGAIEGQRSKDYNNGIYIDVFVLDGFHDNAFIWFLQKHFLMVVTKLLSVYYTNESQSQLKKIINFCFRRVAHLFAYEKLWGIHMKISSLFNKVSKRVSLITCINWFTEKYWMYKQEICNTRFYDFEMLKVPGPSDADSVLSRPYGNYMKFPPKEDRGKWHQGKIMFDPDKPYLQVLS